MKLRGIEFGKVFTASGTLNFFGDGWPFHRVYKALFDGFDFRNSTFIAKTTTLDARAGNLPLDENFMPKVYFPDCIKVNFLKGVVLNAVGLSGPGAKALLEKNIWQRMEKPFFISFMAVGSTKEERLEEMRAFVKLLQAELKNFRSPFGLQINVSCPNTKHCTTDLYLEAIELLKIAGQLGIPLDLKVNVLVEPEFVKSIEASGLCDCITCSNTIPWGRLPDKINWKKLFGSDISPLAKYGGGGLSGWPLLAIVADWVKQVRALRVKLPIKAGGGILHPGNALIMRMAGASAIEIGCISILRPRRIKETIRFGNAILGSR